MQWLVTCTTLNQLPKPAMNIDDLLMVSGFRSATRYGVCTSHVEPPAGRGLIEQLQSTCRATQVARLSSSQ